MMVNQRVFLSQNASFSMLLMLAVVSCISDVTFAFQHPPALLRSVNTNVVVPRSKQNIYSHQQAPAYFRDSCSLLVASSPSDTTPTSPNNNIIHNRGDTRGAALLMEGVSIFRGPERIIKGVDWRVEPRTKWALVGANGAGKSTLLKAVVGEILHEGKIAIGSKEQVGYLQQSAVAGSSKSVFDEAASGMIEINEVKAEIERAAKEADLDALEKANARFEAVGGYKQEQKVASILKGLGFTDFEKRCDELSGGWQMRVAFARLLLSEPTLCLMDEPGNHLDAAAKKWLAKYLADYDGEGAMILVTHDVALLSSMDHIAEVIPGGGSLQTYKSCNYQEYLELKEARAAAAVTEYEKNSVKAAKLQGFVDRFGASATKASAAQSRVKMLEKMEKQGLLDAPAEDIVAERFRPTLILPKPPKAIGDVLLSLTGAMIGYEGKTLVSNVNLEITRGMKLLIRGPNGAGKSTALHSLRGTLPLLQGERKENQSLHLGVFTQDLAQLLDPKAKAVDLVTAYARTGSDGDITISDSMARSAMGRLGLQGQKALRLIGELSGGEKARVALAMFALKPSNVYLLDEVSNHLDTECVEALSDALSTWGDETGAIVVVSHDKEFCGKIGFSHVASVLNGVMVVEQRDARESDWIITDLSSEAVAEEDEEEGDGINAEAKPPKKELDPSQRKQAFNAPKRIEKLGQLIEKAEDKMASIDADMLSHGADVGKLCDLQKVKDSLEREVENFMNEWEELEELLAQIA